MSYDDPAEVFPVYQRSGNEFIYVLEGELTYRHGRKLFAMSAGDSLLFDAAVPHGPEKLSKTPVRYVAVVCYPRESRTMIVRHLCCIPPEFFRGPDDAALEERPYRLLRPPGVSDP